MPQTYEEMELNYEENKDSIMLESNKQRAKHRS